MSLYRRLLGPRFADLPPTLRVLHDGAQATAWQGPFLGVPLPRFLVPEIRAVESEQSGRFHFDIEARLPGFGRLVHYRGWLEPAPVPAPVPARPIIATKQI